MSGNQTTPTPRPATPAPAQPAAPAPQVVPVNESPEALQEQRDARFRASRGGQVVLAPESDASLGARGGAGGSIEENEFIRNKHLLDHSLDPRDPDASHLPENTVPSGGEVMQQVSDQQEPAFKPEDAGLKPADDAKA